MKRIVSLSLLAGLATSAFPIGTLLTAGDLAVVGYNSFNPDTVKLVSMVDLAADTAFTITDYGWRSDNTLRTGGEGWVTVRVGSAVAAGTVLGIQRENDGSWTSNSGLIVDAFDGTATAPEFAPSSAGDGIIVFQGPFDDTTGVVSGNLIYAINAESTGAPANGWQANATNSNTSALPTGLVDGQTAIGLARTDGEAAWATEFDNYRYIGTRTGTRTELLTAIGSRANWEGKDGTNYEFDKSSFQVVPEPMTMSALGLGVLALARRRNRR